MGTTPERVSATLVRQALAHERASWAYMCRPTQGHDHVRVAIGWWLHLKANERHARRRVKRKLWLLHRLFGYSQERGKRRLQERAMLRAMSEGYAYAPSARRRKDR